MSAPAGAPIVVGVDGSPASLHAVRWATREAAERSRPLTLVHAHAWLGDDVWLGPGWGLSPEEEARAHEIAFLVPAAEAARETDATVDVSAEMADGSAADVLLSRSRGAAMIVVGRRGHGGFAGLLLGSTAGQVVTYASCPVAVIPEHEPDPAPDSPGVVLGVDGSRGCQAAIGFAFEAADLRRLPLTAVRAWTTVNDDPALVQSFVPLDEDLLAEQRRVVREALAGWAEKYPDVEVRTVVRHGTPARAVLGVGGDAAMIVVGSRGSGGFIRLLLGSVAETVARHATCLVVVVPMPGGAR
jgi:nucleotide-binding universal stress UspA family protein